MFRRCNIQEGKYLSISPLDFGIEDCASEHSFGPVVRLYWLLHFVISGKGTYTVNNTTYEITPGQAFLIKPDEITKYTADKDEPWTYTWVGFSADIPALNNLPYVIDDDDLRETFFNISQKFSTENQAYAIMKTWQVFNVLTKYFAESNSSSYTERAIDIVKTQYMHDISVKSIAEQLNLDRSYFANVFKKDMGISPSQYIINFRMKKALQLLSSEKYSISIIATSVGYSDLFTFSRSFKKFFGVPPQKYKDLQTSFSDKAYEVKIH